MCLYVCACVCVVSSCVRVTERMRRICVHLCAYLCECVCGPHSWGWRGSNRVPWPVSLLPHPPSQRVLTQGGTGSLGSGFPGWAEVVSQKGNNCILKWTLKGLGWLCSLGPKAVWAELPEAATEVLCLERAWGTCPKALPDALHTLRGPHRLGLWAWVPPLHPGGEGTARGKGDLQCPQEPAVPGAPPGEARTSVWFPAHFSLHRPHPPQPPEIKPKIFQG